MIRNLEVKSGKTLHQWIAIAKTTKLAKHGEIVRFLKANHGFTHGYANLVALKALASATGVNTTESVANQYSGPKRHLRPIYQSLLAAVSSFGPDVDISPKKAYVSLRRSKQFAIIQPSTATRVDVGLNLPGFRATRRLEASGSFNAMVTHRVRVDDKRQVDAELIAWLKTAYDAA